MKNGIPSGYLAFRTAWSALHIALLVVAALVLVRWWLHDSQGSEMVSSWWSWASGVQRSMSRAVPLPWQDG